MPSKHFHDLLNECKEVHDRKSHDYSGKDNPFSNFERMAEIVSWFNDPIDQVFVALIAVKIARLAELHNGKSPKNESIDDSHVDLVNYTGLWGAYKRSKISNKPYEDLCNECALSIHNKVHLLPPPTGHKFVPPSQRMEESLKEQS